MKKPSGNLLGNVRAEADTLMLDKAFVKTADYDALINTTDFHFVVGRRGAGKSALCHQTYLFYKADPRILSHKETPEEHEALKLISYFDREPCTYQLARAASRLIWRSYLLFAVSSQLVENYKVKKIECSTWLLEHFRQFKKFTTGGIYRYANDLLTQCQSKRIIELPAEIAKLTAVSELESSVKEALEAAKKRAILLFDSLDEGWQPTSTPTALLGGLAVAASDLSDAQTGIHAIAFMRDNMFRALAHFDPDFSRNIEGSDLRLSWSENPLFHLVTERIKIALELTVENDTKAWTRFAHRGLEGRSGFARCLQNTLYRPRDVLSLLNDAYSIAKKDNRTAIIDIDVEAAAKQISEERLSDLLKEYYAVFPGLRLFVELFRGRHAIESFDAIEEILDLAVRSETYVEEGAGDFALLGSGREIFYALYSIGFLGVEDAATKSFSFCHDGARSILKDLPPATQVVIHPCYWRALAVSSETPLIDLLTDVHDEYKPEPEREIKDLRLRRLGQIVEELPKLAPGAENAGSFEDWVLRAVRILFTGHLQNVELHPNGDSVQRRDIVATNASAQGFWRRILEDYKARHIVFEVKNYEHLKPDDYRQALSYSGASYGHITFIVYRTENEGANENERSWLQTMYFEHKHLIILMPARVLSRYLSKQRSKRRNDYWDEDLGKRLDTHLRSYLSISSSGGAKTRRPRRRSTKPTI